MGDKKHINDLQLGWSLEGDIADDSQIERDILHELRPHVDLKELTISGYRGTIFPNWLEYSSYHNMTKLALMNCRNCCMLPSLGQLPSLNYLKISKFDVLKIISAEFYKNVESCLETPFPSLETLRLISLPCWKEWHSLEFSAFPRLKELVIRDCPVLTGDLPNHLPALETLELARCEQLNSSIPRAPAIHDIWITGADGVRMGELPFSVRSLIIKGSHLVEPVLEAITHRQLTCLQSLIIGECSSAISFPVACIPTSLLSLGISNCSKLEFQFQQQHVSLNSLGSLGIHGCGSLTSIPLDAFPHLKTPEIRRCENLKSLVVSQSLTNLHDLTMDDCPSFKSFSTLGMFAPQLESLIIEHCPEIELFPEGDLKPNLTLLCIDYCEKLMSFLSSMNSHSHCLTHLEIDGGQCDGVTSFPKEGLLPASLESLELWNFPSLETMECKGLVHLTSLQRLNIYFCRKLENVEGERLPASLIRLSIDESPLLAKRCEIKDPQIWPKISHIRGIQVSQKWIF